jgi:hypothetical protein
VEKQALVITDNLMVFSIFLNDVAEKACRSWKTIYDIWFGKIEDTAAKF